MEKHALYSPNGGCARVPLVTHLQRTVAHVPLPEGDLDVHDVLGLGERVLDLAGASAVHEARGARPPGLSHAGDAVARVGGFAASAPFLAAAVHVGAPAGARVVAGGRHPDLGHGAGLHGAFDGRKGPVLLPGDELVRHHVVVRVAEAEVVVAGRGLLAEARGALVLAVEAGAVGAAQPAVVVVPGVSFASAEAAVSTVPALDFAKKRRAQATGFEGGCFKRFMFNWCARKGLVWHISPQLIPRGRAFFLQESAQRPGRSVAASKKGCGASFVFLALSNSDSQRDEGTTELVLMDGRGVSPYRTARCCSRGRSSRYRCRAPAKGGREVSEKFRQEKCASEGRAAVRATPVLAVAVVEALRLCIA